MHRNVHCSLMTRTEEVRKMSKCWIFAIKWYSWLTKISLPTLQWKLWANISLPFQRCGLKNIYKNYLPTNKLNPPRLYTQTHFFCWRNKHITLNETHVLQWTRTDPLTNFLPTLTLVILIFNCKMIQTACLKTTGKQRFSTLNQTYINYINCGFIKKWTSVCKETYVYLLLEVVTTEIEVC